MSADTKPNSMLQRVMVLAAGLGERMRPITDTLPKPLIELRGRTLLDSILDRAEAAGVPEAVVNLHYLGEMIEARLARRARPRVNLSREETRLETGGGVRKALSLLGADAFFVINGDVSWLDGHTPALERLAAAWDDQEMDALLLLHPTAFAVGYAGVGISCWRRTGACAGAGSARSHPSSSPAFRSSIRACSRTRPRDRFPST